ncbi:MAG: hypothetical protein ACI9U2_002760 [Bradymonadia bacterium]|jgi:hypothetical protein
MRWILSIAALSAAFALAACDDAAGDPPPDMGPADRGAPPPTCVESATTHREIINACTTATGVQKVAVTPLLRADGALPPLP